MNRIASRHREIADEGGRRTLAEQPELLEAKRAEVKALRQRGGGPDDSLTNDLAGVRSVLRAALLLGEALADVEQEKLENPEREALELLREATNFYSAL